MKEKDKLVSRGLKDLIKEHSVDKLLENEIVIEVNLDEIKPNPYQPRKYFDESKIDELASSIKEHGVFQPIIIKNTKDGYIIVAGERRYRASKKLGLTKIPAVVRNYTDSRMAEISLVENLQREDLSAIEEAKAYHAIIDNSNITPKELAAKVSKSRSHITNMLGLLNLPEDIQEMITSRKISMGHARTLSKLEDEEKVREFANQIVNENLSVRDIEQLAFEELRKNKVRRKSLNRKYKEERNVLNKYYNSNITIRNDRIIFKLDDEENLQKLIEMLIKNAL